MWKNIVGTGRPQTTIRRMRIACWLPKATNKHSEYVTLTGFAQQGWFHEGPSVLRNMHFACFGKAINIE